MESIKLNSKKSLEIMTDIVRKVNNLNMTTKNLQEQLNNITENNTWVCENAEIFKNKSLDTLKKFNFTCQDMYKDVLSLISNIEKYEQVEDGVIKNV